jgi:hypothetical protein
MKKVLLLNHDKVECGTYQYMKRIYSIVSGSDKVNYVYKETKDLESYYNILREVKPDITIYNWHRDRMGWITEGEIINSFLTKHYFLFHDGSIINVYSKYLFCGELPNYPTTIRKEDSILLPRPILDYDGSYPINDVPTIGSFGFATDHKRFPELVKLVNDTFDKAHVRLHITSPYFGVTEGYNLPKIVAKCQANNTNPGVKLTITSDFTDDYHLLRFLAGNDINIFYYEHLNNPGISSAIDYALSIRRPFGVTNASLFRHVYNEHTSVETNSISDIIAGGIAPFEEFYTKWNPSEFRKQFNRMFE